MSKIDGISGIAGAIGYTPQSGVSRATEGAVSPGGQSDQTADEIMQMKRLGVVECQTCANRTYQDGSDDPGVSMKAPTKLSPSEAASAVVSHEREHYGREAAKAENEDREVLSNSIKIFTSVCSECGKTYVSGGLTTTVTKGKSKSEDDGLKALLGIETDNEKDPNSVFNINRNIANTAFGLNYDKKK